MFFCDLAKGIKVFFLQKWVKIRGAFFNPVLGTFALRFFSKLNFFEIFRIAQ